MVKTIVQTFTSACVPSRTSREALHQLQRLVSPGTPVITGGYTITYTPVVPAEYLLNYLPDLTWETGANHLIAYQVCSFASFPSLPFILDDIHKRLSQITIILTAIHRTSTLLIGTSSSGILVSFNCGSDCESWFVAYSMLCPTSLDSLYLYRYSDQCLEMSSIQRPHSCIGPRHPPADAPYVNGAGYNSLCGLPPTLTPPTHTSLGGGVLLPAL